MQNLDGVIVSWNKGAERVFGYREGEVIGTPADVIFTEEDRAEGVPAAERRRASDAGRAEDERWHMRQRRPPDLLQRRDDVRSIATASRAMPRSPAT